MATKKAAKTEATRYFVVNKAGTIHEVSKEHATERLGQVGWRQPTADELKRYIEAGGYQTWDNPICPPWSPEPKAVAVEEIDLTALQMAFEKGDDDTSKPTV